MKGVFGILSVCLYAVAGLAQEMPEQIDPQRLSDDLFGYQDADDHSEDAYENLMQLLSSPIDLNRVSAEALKSLHLLTDRQVDNFIAYRNTQGRILEVYELQIIPGFDLDLIGRLLPFVTVKDPLNSSRQNLLRRIVSADHTYLLTRYERTLELPKGFRRDDGMETPFKGSPDKIYYRLRSAIPGDFSFGVTGEKDSGEKILFNPKEKQWGFDFTSVHFQLQNKGRLKNLVLGDFQMQFAQGLVLGGAFGLGKGGESVSTTRRSSAGFLPYTSVGESRYQRGAAVTLQISDPIHLSAFYSHARRDANVAGEGNTEAVTSFSTSGYHRSAGELAARKKVEEQGYGMVVQYSRGGLDLGLTVHAVAWNIPVQKEDLLYNGFAFRGSRHVNTGMFINYRFNNISLFSEVAQSLGGGRAGLAGMLFSPHQHVDLAILYRNYMRSFHVVYSNAFSENTLPQNERGLYWGWKYGPSRKYSLTGYVDLFTFPWLGFRRYSPSTGMEWLLRTNYRPSRKVSTFMQFREERKSRNLADEGNLYRVGEGIKRNLALQIDYGLGGNIRLRSRIQYNQFHFNERFTEGFAAFQDIRFSAGRFSFTGRHALFDTEDYDNRHYMYEQDAWLAHSFPVYSGTGVRNYALFEFKAHKRLTFWVRYARTRLVNADEIGSGSGTIEGNTKNDVKFQVRVRF